MPGALDWNEIKALPIVNLIPPKVGFPESKMSHFFLDLFSHNLGILCYLTHDGTEGQNGLTGRRGANSPPIVIIKSYTKFFNESLWCLEN